ncbi:hypothetical protein AKJ37_05880, partial [candidate division MSBL1 archaeon SCGC-AAA259I09]
RFCLYFVSQKPRNNGAKGLYPEIKELVSKLGIKELITSLMSLKGYKSYSHICLISFLREHYPQLQEGELELIDQMRRIRNDIMYRGEPIASDYLKRRKGEIIEIIEKLTELSEEKI